MTTADISLTPGSALFPDGSTGNEAAGLVVTKASGSAPNVFVITLRYDASTNQRAMWQFTMPNNYASGPTLTVHGWADTATSGNVLASGRMAAWTPGDTAAVPAHTFAAANNSSATAVPGTNGYPFSVSITLTNADSVAAGDSVVVYLERLASDGSDTAAGYWLVSDVDFSYTTT